MVAQLDELDGHTRALAIVSAGDQGDASGALILAQDPRTDDVPTVDLILAAWLHAKATRTNSAKTARAYAETFASFRAYVQAAGLGDVDAPHTRQLAHVLQAWAHRPRQRDGRPVSPSTANQRAAIVSSFYTFARRRGLLMAASGSTSGAERKPVENPATFLDRRPVQAYAAARPLDYDAIRAAMERIDRKTPAGLRDYALLMLGLRTGRRLAELAALTWGDLYLSGGRVTITWRRTKGGKMLTDTVSQVVTDALLAWLYVAYGRDLGTLAHDAPVFISLATNGTRGHALTAQAVATICQKRIGTSKVHTLRHTFAVAMEDAGASISEIQERLGHSNAATTSRYLARLRSAENAHGDALDELYGWRRPARSAKVTRPLGRKK